MQEFFSALNAEMGATKRRKSYKTSLLLLKVAKKFILQKI